MAGGEVAGGWQVIGVEGDRDFFDALEEGALGGREGEEGRGGEGAGEGELGAVVRAMTVAVARPITPAVAARP